MAAVGHRHVVGRQQPGQRRHGASQAVLRAIAQPHRAGAAGVALPGLHWRLRLKGDPDSPLNGELIGASVAYAVEGVGTAFGSTRHGPTGGYYIKQNDRTVVSLQTTGKREVLFASGAQSDALVAAAVVLLLIDQSVRDLDCGMRIYRGRLC